MGVIEALLAIVGLLFLLVLLIGALSQETPAPTSPSEDAATPYREGLHAAVRMQQVAQDLEQQIYAEAARQMEHESASSEARQRP